MREERARRRQSGHGLLVLFAGKADHPAILVQDGRGRIFAPDGFRVGEQAAATARLEAAVLSTRRAMSPSLCSARAK